MPELPAEAVQAATLAHERWYIDHGGDPDEVYWTSHEQWASTTLEAAAPFLAEHIARQLAPVWDWTREVAAAHGTTYGVDAVGRCMRIAREAFTAGVGSPTSCPSAAPESTQSPETTSAAPVYPPGPVGPAETLSALRDRYAAALAATCKLHEIEGACPACERRLTAVLGVRDDELSRALRIADYHAGQHRQAEAAIARSRAALAEFDARPWHDVPTPGSVLEAWRTSLGVSEEQTGPLRHLGGNAEDCPACDITTMPYPFLCPGEEQTGGGNG